MELVARHVVFTLKLEEAQLELFAQLKLIHPTMSFHA
jgi:hypothetical protein